jgi:D-tyrosyl-tRNA(Tyr) deacylase
LRVIVQRVSRARVSIRESSGAIHGAREIGRGLAVLVGFTHSDTLNQVEWMAEKLLGLRIFPDAEDKMNLAVGDVAGGILVVSQFTLYGDASKGRRPSFVAAARPETAEPLYEAFLARLVELAPNVPIASGEFGANMAVELVNDGPVTLSLER